MSSRKRKESSRTVVGLLECKGWVMGSTSLKEKRRIIQSRLVRIRNKFNLSVAEVGEQNDRQWTALAVSGVASHKKIIENELRQALRLLEEIDGLEITQVDITFM